MTLSFAVMRSVFLGQYEVSEERTSSRSNVFAIGSALTVLSQLGGKIRTWGDRAKCETNALDWQPVALLLGLVNEATSACE